MNLYTLGYQGVDLSNYVGVLKSAGVGVVADVRETPWSHKRGFCKNALATELLRAGIEYVHLKSAGNPKENRRTASSPAECLRRYKAYLVKNPQGVSDLVGLVEKARAQNKSVCLTCFEKDANECHRSILIGAIGKKIQIKPVDL